MRRETWREVDRFERLYRAHARKVLAYAQRRVSGDDAQEVLAETFLTAWRRLDDVPADALPWLLSTARNLISNHRRTAGRRAALAHKLRMAVGPLTRQGVDPTDANQLGDAVLEAMTALSEREREALMLVYWDDLDIAVAAAVAECSPRAMTTRLHRARRHLALHLARAGVLHLIDEQANPHDRARAGRSEP